LDGRETLGLVISLRGEGREGDLVMPDRREEKRGGEGGSPSCTVPTCREAGTPVPYIHPTPSRVYHAAPVINIACTPVSGPERVRGAWTLSSFLAWVGRKKPPFLEGCLLHLEERRRRRTFPSVLERRTERLDGTSSSL